MPRTVNMRDDEKLAHEVQKYKCIYDKADPGHKDKDRINNAWREVDKSLGLEEGKKFLFYSFVSLFFVISY